MSKQIFPTYMDTDDFVGNCYQCECDLYLYSYKLHRGKHYCRKCVIDDFKVSKAKIREAINKAVDVARSMK